VIEAIRKFELKEQHFSPREIQKHARKFDKSIFKNRLRAVVDEYCSLDLPALRIAR
jgi:hypothetical protein